MLQLIDRRLNGRNKSLLNRERFLRRYKSYIQRAVERMVSKRGVTDMAQGGEVSIPARDISEPVFRHGPGGDREIVFPGNRTFSKGDTLPRERSGEGEGGGSGAGQGESADDFIFTLTRSEFLNIFFDDLELPRLLRTRLGQAEQQKSHRAGFTTDGAPCNLSVPRTLQNALGRRIALTGAANERIEQLRGELGDACSRGLDAQHLALLEAEQAALHARARLVPFLESIDLRYRNRVMRPSPVARAVMFCLMDVSASMTEHKKDLAKRFFTLLYLFLTKKYEQVEIVFIRHTDEAEEVPEKVFFEDPRTGGTVVCSALELMHDIVTARYPANEWNVYAAQASDGDAFGSDVGKSTRFLEQKLLPLSRYFAYIEVPDYDEARPSTLWAAYESITGQPHFALRRVIRREDIYPVFRELFRKEA